MEFDDIKTVLLLINGLLLPCILWVWRISTNQKLLQNRFDTMQGDYTKQTNDLTLKIAEMPTHKTIHSIEKTLIKIDGHLKVITTEINHTRENNRSFEEALVRMDNKIQKSVEQNVGKTV